MRIVIAIETDRRDNEQSLTLPDAVQVASLTRNPSSAGFIAQLLATRHHLLQALEHTRCTYDGAVQHYVEASAPLLKRSNRLKLDQAI